MRESLGGFGLAGRYLRLAKFIAMGGRSTTARADLLGDCADVATLRIRFSREESRSLCSPKLSSPPSVMFVSTSSLSLARSWVGGQTVVDRVGSVRAC